MAIEECVTETVKAGLPNPENLNPGAMRYLVQLHPEWLDGMTPGGIHLPKGAEQKRPATGTVIRLGPGCKESLDPFEEGDLVLILRYSGNDVPVPLHREENEKGMWVVCEGPEILAYWRGEGAVPDDVAPPLELGDDVNGSRENDL